MAPQGSFKILSKKNIMPTFSWGEIHSTCRLRVNIIKAVALNPELVRERINKKSRQKIIS